MGTKRVKPEEIVSKLRQVEVLMEQGMAPLDAISELARQYGRYGHRRIAALLRDAGWQVSDKRALRLWRHGVSRC